MAAVRVGPYELLDPLGEGGMGTVYRARDTRLNRVVAIKFLRGPIALDPERRLRFLREARAAAALNQINIATVLDVGEAEVDLPDLVPTGAGGGGAHKVPYLVLEHVPGIDLRTRIHQGPIPLGETLRLASQIVAGLRAAHAAGIVHRDLKPANMRITPDALLKILDFGLARFVTTPPPASGLSAELQTVEGSILGTPPYLAPEQAAGLPADERADLFALGVILFQMLSGELPFRGNNPFDLIRSVLRDDPVSLIEKAPGTPPRLAALVASLLVKNPTERIASAEEVARELEAVSHDLATGATSIGLPESARPASISTPLPLSHRSRARLWFWSAAAAAILVVAGLALLFDRRSRAEAERLVGEGRAAEEISDPQAARIAAEMLERATRLHPNLVSAWAALSHALTTAYIQERMPELLDRAESAAERAFALDPGALDARLARARIARLRGDAEGALQTLSELHERGEGADRVERELAEAWEQVGDTAQAEQHLLAAVAAKSDAWGNWNALGDFRVRTGNYSGARAAFERAREMAPRQITTPAQNLASVLFVLGKYAEALTAYEAIPGNLARPEAASNRGTLYYFNGRFEDAERDFREAISLAPREPGFHRNLADTLLRLERGEEARAEYARALLLAETLLTETPQDSELRLQRTLYLARTGDCERAKQAALELESELAESASSVHALARPFALCGAPAEALLRLRRAVALGYPREPLRDEDELAPLRSDPEFWRFVGGGSVPP